MLGPMSQSSKLEIEQAYVGCMVGSCGSCNNCKRDLENYCPKMTWTYVGQYHDGLKNFGGYSDKLVVEEHFAVLVPNILPLAGAAPLVCAGINYSVQPHDALWTLQLRSAFGCGRARWPRSSGCQVCQSSRNEGHRHKHLSKQAEGSCRTTWC
jgi:hypothetical protein